MSQSTESKSQQSKQAENRVSGNDVPQRIEDHSHESCQSASSCGRINVGEEERLASTVGGAVIAAYGLVRSGPVGLLLTALGVGLVYRGATGHCSAYKALSISTANNDNDGNAQRRSRISAS